MKRLSAGVRLCLVGLLALLAFRSGAATVADLCVLDLAVIPEFLRANDAGMQGPIGAAQQDSRDMALELARREAVVVEDDARCAAALQTYLKAWRKGHLTVKSVKVPADIDSAASIQRARSRLPSLRFLSPQTALLTIPSFLPQTREPLRALLAKNRRPLASHRNWIIDVRGNDGGADTAYAPLLPLLLPQGWFEASEQVFVTQANIKAHEHLCELVAPGDAGCESQVDDTMRRMRAAAPGTWIQQEDAGGWRHERPAVIEPRRPARVAVLMDSRCASSCEAFLLTVRQGFGVKLVGHSRSYGAIDASNLRPYLLPSAKRRLWYATTRSNRLPGLPLDDIGVSPDVLLPDATDTQTDIPRTRRWLEGGGWGG